MNLWAVQCILNVMEVNLEMWHSNSGFSPRAHRRQLTVLCNLYHSNALVPTGTVHTWSLDIHIWLNKIKKNKDDEITGVNDKLWVTTKQYARRSNSCIFALDCIFLHFHAVIFHTICLQLLRRRPRDLCLLSENTFVGQISDFETNERLQDICSQQKFQEVVGIFPTFLPLLKYSEFHVPENTTHIDWWNRADPSTDMNWE